MEKWSHKSLEWIHRVREENYKETKDMPISELLGNIRQTTDEIIESLNLKTIGSKSEFFRPVVRDKEED